MKLIINRENDHAINILSAREAQDQIRYNVVNKLICFLQVGERINADEPVDEKAATYLRQFLENGINLIEIKNENEQIIYSTTKYTRYTGISKSINELSTEITISFE